jgi:hypothetical protein
VSNSLRKLLATEIARDPSRASRLCSYLAEVIQEEIDAGAAGHPPGYIYAPGHQWIVKVIDLDPEPLPTTDVPNAAPITSSFAPAIPFRVPFDALLLGVSGWALPEPTPIDGVISVNALAAAQQLSSAADGRDLFTTSIGLDGQITFGTDGRDQLMFPASTVVGTRLRPRVLGWTVRRQQILQVKFRNITNAPLGGVASSVVAPLRLSEASLNFHALNLEMP